MYNIILTVPKSKDLRTVLQSCTVWRKTIVWPAAEIVAHSPRTELYAKITLMTPYLVYVSDSSVHETRNIQYLVLRTEAEFMNVQFR
jgi:hypothetical protein